MDASVQPATSVFLQLFRAHCSPSDLGQINVNWFEDLSREAARIPPSLQEEVRSGGRQDDNLFKTPRQKPCHYSQLESTPAIFKEQSLFFPLFLSPKKDNNKSGVTAENYRNVDKTQQSPDNSESANEVFGTSSRYLSGSPAFPKQLYKTPVQDKKCLQKTPQQDRQFDIFGSLLCTPQMIWNQSSRCISESLGVEADPEMSWSSSLATPPSPTLIIAQPPEGVSKPRTFDRDDVMIVRSLFSKMNSVADASLAPPSGTKTDGDSTNFGKNTDTAMSQNMEKSSDYLKTQQRRTTLNAVAEEGEELGKVKVDRQTQRKNKPLSGATGKNDSLMENVEEQNTLFDTENHTVNGKLLQQKTCSRELALSYEWTQLSLPDTPQEGSIAVEIGSCGDGITKKKATCTDSQLRRNGTAASETNKINQDDLLSTFQYEEHKVKSDDEFPCDAIGDNKPLLGLVSSDHSSSFTADDDKPWKNSSIADQKPKPILSTLKKQTKFLYSLKIDGQQTETTEKIDMTLRSRSSHGLEKPDDRSTKFLDTKNAAPAFNLSEVKEVVMEEDDDFKLNSIDFQQIEESCMNMMQTGPADSTATPGVKSNVNRTAVTSVGGDSVERRGAKSECISQLFDGQAQLSDRSTKVSELACVTNGHNKGDHSQENPFISGNNCNSTHTTTHPDEAESKSVNKTCSDLLAGEHMQSFGVFKTSSNKKIYIEENLRKGKDEGLTISCPIKIENGDTNPELNEENKTLITPSMYQQPDLESPLKGDTGIESLKENSVKVLNATPTKISKTNLHDVSSGMESHLYDSFTESQKAEIIELSSIFENAGSQFDFTQVNKLNILGSGKENLQNPKSISDSQKLNMSDASKDVDFCDGFGTGEGNKANVCSVATESESKGDTGTNLCDIADNKSVPYSCMKPRLGFTLASGKSVNITDEDLIKAMEMFSDMEEKTEEKNGKTMQDLNCLSNSQTFSVLDNTTNSRSATLPGNDGLNSMQTTAISSHALTKEKCLSDVGMANKQDYKSKSDEKRITKLHPTEMESSKRSFPLKSNQDRAFSNYENRAPTSCLPTMPVGFATGKGKMININKASFDKARTIFNDILETDLYDDHCRTPKRHEPSSLLIETNAGQTSSTSAGKETHGPTSYPVRFSKEHIVPSVTNDVLTKPKQIVHVIGKEMTKESGLAQQNNPMSNMSLFSTARGKPIQLSEEALRKAHRMFSEVDDGHVGEQQTTDITSKESTVNSSSLHDLNPKSVQDMETTFNFPQPGFSTANGKKIEVSEKCLQRAREIYADIEEPNVLEVGQRNLSSRSKSEVSDREKNNVCDISESLNPRTSTDVTQVRVIKPLVNQITTGPSTEVSAEITPLDNVSKKEMSNRTFSCKDEIPNLSRISFSTAAGKPYQLSEDSLKKAQAMFADLEDSLLQDQGEPGSLVHQTPRRNPKSSLPSLGSSRTSGRTLAVTESSLQTARQTFVDTCDTVPDMGHTRQENTTVFALPTMVFKTASEKTVTVSDESLQKAKLLFAVTDDPLDTAKNSVGNTAIKMTQNEEREDFSAVATCQTNKRCSVTGKANKEANQSKSDTREPVLEGGGFSPKMPCFRTAGGKSVTVSEKSLKRAQEIFSEVDNGCPSQNDAGVDIQTNPKSTSSAKLALREKTLAVESSGKKYSPNVPTKTSFGFSTASGKQVCVSEEALQKVKGFFEEGNTNENLKGNLNENQESIRMNTLNPLPSKQPFKDSVTKLDYLQKNTMEGNEGNQKTSTRASDFPPRFVKHSTPLHVAGATNVCSASSHNPGNDFEFEAAESAKAFMDDDQTNGLFPSSTKLPNMRNEKRLRSDDGLSCGEPPFKRQLLPEFDRSLVYDSALKPLASSPHESLKDRRKYFCNASLQPLSSDPASFSKGKPNALESRHPAAASCHAIVNVSRSSLPTSSTHVPTDGRNDPNSTSKNVRRSFVIPFKKKTHVSSGEHTVNVPRRDQDNAKDITESRIAIGTAQKDESGTDFSDLVPSICCARDMQEMRIRKKQRQKIKPQPGSLYLQKTSSTDRINLVTAVEGRQPAVYTQTELYRCGVLKNHIGINSEEARTFRFHCLDYFSRECFLSEGEVQIADGGWLVPADTLTAGREEFYRALCDTPGVDPKLISPEWVYNHYRWIVWKLAAMEVMFPMIFAGRCLTPDRVLLQLKYRYDVEIDNYRRSAVRKIMERDDTAAKTLVLCISRILTLGNREMSDTKQSSAVLEVTDGWYGLKALLDPALTCLLQKGRMFIGQKIMVHGAELVGSDDACTPLEAPEALMLKIARASLCGALFWSMGFSSGLWLGNYKTFIIIWRDNAFVDSEIAGNSTRPARWYTRLGYFQDPRPFCLRLSSLLADGGIVGCVDVLIQRIYPIQWMEKMGNGTYVFRNERAEEREAERHCLRQQKSLEVLFVKIQEDYEKRQACSAKRRPRCQSLSEPQIRALQDGAELCEALQNESDPGYLESCLSSDQLRALNHHRQLLNDKRHAEIQAEFRKAVESSEQEAGSGARRDVTPVWKMRIVDYKDQDSASAYTLNIWRPLPDVVSLLKEGGRFKIYQLAASQSKGKCDAAAVQLTATKKTQFQQLQPLQHILQQIYTERQVTEFSQFLEPHFTADYGEVDVVGLIISTQQKPGAAPLVYLSDEMCNVMALKFNTDLGQLALEELTRPCGFIAAANLCWRSEYISGVPVVFAGELSFIAANPKEQHLQKAIQKLRQSIQSVPEFCREIENKLMNILQTRNPQERVSFLELRSHVAAASKSSINNPKMLKLMATPDRSNTVLSTSILTDPKTCKKMKGLDYLGRIPSPAPLTPMGTLPSPSLQRAFRPPRSLHKEDSPCTKTSLNTDSCTPSKLEEGFVTDEELAMIDTQALVLGLEGGSKRSTQQEAAETQKKSPNINCPASEEAQKTQEVGPAPFQGRLCRKRKAKP